MSTCGLTCTTSRIFCSPIPKRGPHPMLGILAPLTETQNFGKNAKLLIRLGSNYQTGFLLMYRLKGITKTKSAMGVSFGDMEDDSIVVFPRMNARDPYKLLGISREASGEEIQAARNFLINQYAGHKPSVNAIEKAYDKIIIQSFNERMSPKLNIKDKLRSVTHSRIANAATSRFEAPRTNTLKKNAIAFSVLGILTFLFPTEEGPTLQVAISLFLTVYFIYERLKNKVRAFLYGTGAFFVSWLLGTLLMVCGFPHVLVGLRSFEVTTSLITYVLLCLSSASLK